MAKLGDWRYRDPRMNLCGQNREVLEKPAGLNGDALRGRQVRRSILPVSYN
jgi:hypothetical protein